MFQLYTNIQTDFPDQIFLELFQFKTQSRFSETQYIYISHQELVSCNQNIFIIPQELILRPMTAGEKSKVVAGNRSPGLLI